MDDQRDYAEEAYNAAESARENQAEWLAQAIPNPVEITYTRTWKITVDQSILDRIGEGTFPTLSTELFGAISTASDMGDGSGTIHLITDEAGTYWTTDPLQSTAKPDEQVNYTVTEGEDDVI